MPDSLHQALGTWRREGEENGLLFCKHMALNGAANVVLHVSGNLYVQVFAVQLYDQLWRYSAYLTYTLCAYTLQHRQPQVRSLVMLIWGGETQEGKGQVIFISPPTCIHTLTYAAHYKVPVKQHDICTPKY